MRLASQSGTPCIQLFENKDAKEPFQELPLQVAYSLSEISHQVLDQYSKIFTLKLQYIFYKERAGIRPGQVSKMQKLTGKIGFLTKAVEDADYEGVKEFASDMKKLGVPLEHAPQVCTSGDFWKRDIAFSFFSYTRVFVFLDHRALEIGKFQL